MLHVMVINPRTGVSITDVQEMLQIAGWYRIAPNAWVVHSHHSAEFWVRRMGPLVNPGGTMFVSQMNVGDHQGWMDPKFWDWLNVRLFA